ncbi:ABC transporter ATP-binding protein [Candidatus Methanomassiliicoccus intestinalis]|uniref:ABC transporter ATP-binding protein n=1 Tax=Candidatus Methanomassiliicoccus intestinalis TaxID=1406512 RepID=UPI0037DD975D
MDEEIIVRTRDLVKKFGDFTAVDKINVNIRRGEIFGFLGPNGAGKTTTMRIITTLASPTSGSIEIEGHDVTEISDPVKEKIGIIQQHIALDRDVSVRENIRYHAILHRIPKKEAEARIEELASLMGLDSYMDKLVVNLSGGWKRRVAIVCAIIHKPAILFLDEPTAGLDTQSRHMLWDLIRRLNDMGTTIFVTTHYMDEAEELCDRVAIINHGKIVCEGTPAELCSSIGSWAVEYIDSDKRKIYRYFPDRKASKEFQDILPANACVVSRATNLEDVFLELTGRDVEATQEVKYRI